MIVGDRYPDISDWPEMPSNQAAEAAILGHILLDNNVYADVKTLLPDDFTLESHQTIFMRMAEMLHEGRAVDMITLSDYLAGKTIPIGVDSDRQPLVTREIDDIGGVSYLSGLTDGLIRCSAVEQYIEIIKEKARLRRIIAACETAIRASQEQGTTSAEIVEQLGVALKGIRKKTR